MKVYFFQECCKKPPFTICSYLHFTHIKNLILGRGSTFSSRKISHFEWRSNYNSKSKFPQNKKALLKIIENCSNLFEKLLKNGEICSLSISKSQHKKYGVPFRVCCIFLFDKMGGLEGETAMN